eukprot:6462849-Amphidinium_carterae.1
MSMHLPVKANFKPCPAREFEVCSTKCTHGSACSQTVTSAIIAGSLHNMPAIGKFSGSRTRSCICQESSVHDLEMPEN